VAVRVARTIGCRPQSLALYRRLGFDSYDEVRAAAINHASLIPVGDVTQLARGERAIEEGRTLSQAEAKARMSRWLK
jgi:hypothetical protein